MLRSPSRASSTALLIVAGLLAACTPYMVATTARPLAAGERSTTQLFSVVPGGASLRADSAGGAVSMPNYDREHRWGLNERADLGVRVNAGSGLIVTHKRRLGPSLAESGAASALLLGGGLVNLGQHAHVEATWVVSGGETGTVVPYGGVRALQVIPLSRSAVRDTPTAGVYGGTRFGSRDGGVSLELGVFYDRSALGLRRNDLVIVPSINVHGAGLGRLLGW